MIAKEPVFIIGPGFIGWNVLELLVSKGHPVTGLVRRESHAAQIRASGATAVLGDLNDRSLITKHVAEHAITIHTATADHLPSVEAVIEGLRQRAKQSKHSIYIHTSGTNITNDDANGAFKSDTVYHDDDRAQIDAIPHEAPHRDIDVPITKAQLEPDLAKYSRIAIMVPPTIYGINPRHKRISIQWPTLVRFALKQGFAGYVGQGLSVESQIHVLDLAKAYVFLLGYMIEAPEQTFLDNPFFFCENGVETSWLEVSTEIGKALHQAGKINDATPRSIPTNLYGDVFGEATAVAVGLNSRTRANRLRKLGWEAKGTSWKDSLVNDEIPIILSE